MCEPSRFDVISHHAIADQLGDCAEIRFHDLRHTYATLALANSVPIRVVSDTMGHSRSSVTIDTYAHVLPSQERLAADKMDAVLGGSGEDRRKSF